MRRRAFLKNALLATASAGLGFHPAAAQTLPQGDLITGATPIPDNPFMPSIDGLPTITVGDRLARERRDAAVAVVTSADPMEAGYEILRLQNPALRADRALLKVNMSTSTSANWRTLTAKDRPRLYATGSDPRFIAGMMQYLQERGIAYDRITIAEAVGGSDYTMDRFEQMGFTELAAKTGATLVDLNTTDAIGVLIPQSTLMPHVAIAKPVMDHYEDGVLINVPKMKNHRLPVVTLGAKNMMGAILPPNAKRLCHPEFERAAVPGRPSHFYRGAYYEALMYFGARLADLYLITPDLVVIDGIIAGEGSGFLAPDTDETRPVDARRAFASTNMINIDTVVSGFMGYDVRDPQMEDFPEMSRFWWTYFGALRGYGYDDVSRIRIVGDRSLIAPVRRFRLYQAYFLVS